MFYFNMYESLYLTKLTTNFLSNFFYLIMFNNYSSGHLLIALFSIFILIYFLLDYYVYYKTPIYIYNKCYQMDHLKFYSGEVLVEFIFFWTIISFMLVYYFKSTLLISFIIYNFSYNILGMLFALFILVYYTKAINYDRRYFVFNKFYYIADMYILFIESLF